MGYVSRKPLLLTEDSVVEYRLYDNDTVLGCDSKHSIFYFTARKFQIVFKNRPIHLNEVFYFDDKYEMLITSKYTNDVYIRSGIPMFMSNKLRIIFKGKKLGYGRLSVTIPSHVRKV